MLKIIVIILLGCAGLGFLLVLPFFVIGTLIAIFCFWRGWYIAALIFFVLGSMSQHVRGVEGTGGNTGGSIFTDDTDYDSADDDGIGFPEMYVGYKVFNSDKDEKDK